MIDDPSSKRAVLSDLLQPMGFDIVEAADGEQAIHLAQELHPDLILMDCWMVLKPPSGYVKYQHYWTFPSSPSRPACQQKTRCRVGR
jgi:DNA-binding NarL/FixJ family response regulator